MDPELAWKLRQYSLSYQNNLRGSTGLLRTSAAFSSAPGIFRLAIASSFFDSSGFLCDGTTGGGCDRDGDGEASRDRVSHVGMDLTLSATLTRYLEAYAGLHASATSNSEGRPQLLQVLGDSNFGVKGFVPRRPDQLFNVGGEAELWLLNGTGAVGLDGAATSFSLRALGSVDFTNRMDPAERFPLIGHLNLGYTFDNSGKLVEEVERSRNGDRITRIERFGLDVDRVDSLEIGFGAEVPLPYVRPFAEWTFDIPVQRQDYVCNLSRLDPGDGCLGTDAGWSTTPSRLNVGLRATPFHPGFSVLAAFQTGTGATRQFIEEVAPEVPWALIVGVGYAADTKPPRPIVKRVEVPQPTDAPRPPETLISGRVVDSKTKAPVTDVVLRYVGQPYTGMVTNESGVFETRPLPPGNYAFSLSAPGYKPAQCSAVIPGAEPTRGGAQPGQPTSALPPAPRVNVGADGQPRVSVECRIDALPRVGNVVGASVDAESGEPIPGARVRIQDKLGRQLELTADATGAFRFENVPPGVVRLFVTAPDYLPSVTELEVKAREEVRTRLSASKRPRQANVVVDTKEIRIKKPVHFEYDSAKISPDSMALIQEMADVLAKHPELSLVEIQGHTDNQGNAAYNLRLSQERADAVREALTALGVEGSRLVARGYGQEKPIAPNNTDASRARNRRVQLIIQERGAAR
jgi:outer membrane protein OmpA-like peptidoglycan-associated protein